MRATTIIAPALLAATSFAQGPPEGIAPASSPPAGCLSTVSSEFTIGTLKVAHASKRETAQQASDGSLTCNLKNGILRDRDARTGSVVANRQFQFDGPPQAGAIYTGGFSVCTNGSLAIGGSTRWWQCASGGFYNLYDEWIGAQCEEIRIQVNLLNKPSPSPSPTPSPSASPSPSAAASSSVLSVITSSGTISGAVSTISAASAVGPSASLSSTNGSSIASATSSAGSALSSGASASASSSSVPNAPPAQGTAAPSITKGATLGAVMALVGAILVL